MTRHFILALITFLSACNPSHKKSTKEILEQKAFYYYDNNTYSEAINYFDKLIALDSTNGEYYFKRAYCYDKTSLKKHAVLDFEKAASLKYEAADAFKNIGLIAMEVDEDSIALTYFDKGLKIDPSKFKDFGPIIQACKKQIEFQKTDAWKEFEEYKKRTKQN